MRNFRQLNVWSESHSLTLEIYQVTKSFPKDELFALTSQMRRASASIPSNIAEGCGRGTNKEYAQFLQIAMGSASELDYQLLLAKDLKYIDVAVYSALNDKVDKIQRQLNILIRKVRATS
jgi:four helix bundle protein